MHKENTELDDLTFERARRGDRAARGLLIERYQRPVFALLSRMLLPSGRGPATEDLAQETFIRALGALGTFDRRGRARLSTWILTIATRLAIDELRKKPVATEDLASAEQAVDGTPGPLQRAEDRRSGAAIERAVRDLSPEYRAAFLLREVHGLEYLEIADALRVDIGTVKSRLSRARALLRAALSEVCDG